MIYSWVLCRMTHLNVDVMGMQRFYSPRHDAIHFPLRHEKGFHSSLDARQDVRYSFHGNLVFFRDLSSHYFWKSI